MGQVTSLFARKVVEEAFAGNGKGALLRSVGLARGEPVDRARMIADADYYAFLERVAAADPSPTSLPLRAGAAMRCDDYGAFGLAWKSARTLRGSYARAERYWRVLTSVSAYEVEPAEGGALMHLHRGGERRLGLRLSNEATIASIASISREVSTRPFRPLAVYFKHPAPPSTSGHEAYFGCPVHFGAGRDALLVAAATLRTPNRLGDRGLSRFFDRHLDAKARAAKGEEAGVQSVDEGPLSRRVRTYVSNALSEGAPALADAAGHLGMSERTLQRRLREAGRTYQGVVDATRERLARRLLRETPFSLVEVAFMTGYADQSAFTRAFRRWSGQTPRSFRAAPPPVEARAADPVS
jgi:AraC-like DNA-binding protein